MLIVVSRVSDVVGLFFLHSYVQLFFNLAVVGLLLYILWRFVQTVSRDVDLKAEEYSMGTLGSMDGSGAARTAEVTERTWTSLYLRVWWVGQRSWRRSPPAPSSTLRTSASLLRRACRRWRRCAPRGRNIRLTPNIGPGRWGLQFIGECLNRGALA